MLHLFTWRVAEEILTGLHYCSSETAPRSTLGPPRDVRPCTGQFSSPAASSRPSSAPAPPSPRKTTNAYIQEVIAAGGFGRYERTHLATLTATVKSKLRLPARPARRVAEYAFHAGHY